MKLALRRLRKNPGFALVAILTLALGIGANTVIFSAVEAVLLKPLPFRDQARLVQLWETHPAIPHAQVTYPDFVDWRQQASSLEDMTAYTFQGFQKLNLLTGGDPEQVAGTLVSQNFLPFLGLQPVMGRNFLPEEARPGHDRVVLLSHALWQRRFGADPRIVGRDLQIGGETFQVVGVLPVTPFPTWADVLLPVSRLTDFDRTARKHHPLEVLGRLKPGVTLAQAETELQSIALRLQREYPATNNTIGAVVVPFRDQMAGDSRTPLLVLLGAVGLVLLIACANVANLLLARTAARRKEIAVSLALGASRSDVVRQFLCESLLLAMAGAALGLTLAAAGMPVLRAATGGLLPRATEISIDLNVLAFTVGAALLAGVLFGFFPALQATHTDQNLALRETGRTSSGHGIQGMVRRALVVGEVALAVVVLISAGLLVRSFARLVGVDPGFRADHLLTFQITLPAARYQKYDQVRGFYQRLLPLLNGLPGVRSTAAVDALPLTSALNRTRFVVEGAPSVDPGRYPVAQTRTVTPGYFQAMAIALKRGRLFTDADMGTTAQPACLINETLARRFYDGKDPVGQRLLLGVVDAQRTPVPIAGVVADTRELGLGQEPEPQMYFAGFSGQGYVVVRSTMDPLSLADAVRREVLAVDPGQPVAAMRTMDQILNASFARRRFSTLLLSGFSGLALLLAALGLYGVVSYSVTQRTQEMGLRMALGADRGAVLLLVFKESLGMGLIGLVCGMVASLFATDLLGSLLYGISASDPLTFVAVGAVLLAVTAIAAALPALRATRVDPMIALRHS